KGKRRFSLSVERKVPDWTFCDSIKFDGFAKSHQRTPRGVPKSMTSRAWKRCWESIPLFFKVKAGTVNVSGVIMGAHFFT
ncbi:MAG: hypothetical protein RRA15_13285, partial [bacterium]|nr:hypothetical protein [bacterium]